MTVSKLRSRVPEGGKDLIRSATLAAGMATAGARMEPGFLVVGAQRSGTTTLYRMLVEHPCVVRPSFAKGIGYFDLNYGRGERWYRGHFPMRAAAARRTGKSGSPMTFESSGYYLYHPLAAQRIGAQLPEVKVVVLVRDPVERAFSAHAHELARGFESEPFERAIELEPARIEGEEARLITDPEYVSYNHRHFSYLARGRYAEQIQRYYDALGRERVMIIDAQDLFARPEAAYADLLEFLGLPEFEATQTGVHNARPRQEMPDELRRRLMASFEDQDAELAVQMGRTPSWRIQP